MNDLDRPLQEVVDRATGARLAALIGLDGMVVARAGEDDGVPLDVLVATFADLIRRIDRSVDECGLTATEELILGTERGILVVRVLTPEYGVLALLGPGGSLGRVRFELQRAAYALLPQLEP